MYNKQYFKPVYLQLCSRKSCGALEVERQQRNFYAKNHSTVGDTPHAYRQRLGSIKCRNKRITNCSKSVWYRWHARGFVDTLRERDKWNIFF